MYRLWESFRPFFEWHNDVWYGKGISATIWLFPLIETIHILAMTMLFGGLSIINLRMLGFGMKKQPVSLLAKNLNPYLYWSIGIMLVTGYLLFSSEPQKSFGNEGFQFKMAFLFPALIFQMTIYRWVARQEESRRSKIIGAVTAFLSFALWFGVGVGGRAIGFV